MPLQIKTTGVDDYIDGSANIRMLVVGPVDSGKTRMSSFWPKPIYADCEAGRGSIADRGVQYAEVKSSQDMLDFLTYCKQHEGQPKKDRPFQTVVIDTIDGFQRKCKQEWLAKTKAEAFSGYEAWGYLDNRMQMLMTRLLNLDYNVLCLCHYKDKVIKLGDDEQHVTGLYLQGDVKDSALFDFDLVGWLDTYSEAVDGERVRRRGITFKRTPRMPFLKDRFGVMPDWVPIDFTDNDYGRILEAFLSRVDSLKQGEVVGEIPNVGPAESFRTAGVQDPASGPLPAQDPKEVPLTSYDKPTLMRLCKEEDVTTTVDGQPIRQNTIKAELVAALEKKRAEQASAPAPAPEESDAKPASPVEAAKADPPVPEQREAVDEAAPATSVPEANPDEQALETAAELVRTELGAVDVATGEIVEPAADKPLPSQPEVADTSAVPNDVVHCSADGCGIPLIGEHATYIALSKIKGLPPLCKEHYVASRTKS